VIPEASTNPTHPRKHLGEPLQHDRGPSRRPLGDRLAVGTDQKGAFGGVQLPIPLLQNFIPVDFMVQGRPGGFSVYPKIHTGQSSGEDPELYR